jgi:hypothetical protein
LATQTPKIGLNKPVPNVETNWAFRLNESLDILDDTMLTANVSGTGTVIITDDGSGGVLISGSPIAGFGVESLETLQGSITLTAAGTVAISDDGLQNITISGEASSVAGADHSLLSNLDFASAGHTGFASEAELSSASGTLSTQIGTDIATHAGLPSAHHTRYTKEENDALIAGTNIVVVSGANTITISSTGGGGTTANALVGTDGVTVISGSPTDTIQGFRPEFVATSGSLQTQIDTVTLQDTYDNGDGTIQATLGKPVKVEGTVSGTEVSAGNLTTSGQVTINLPADQNFLIDGATNPREVTVGAFRQTHTPAIPGTRSLNYVIDTASMPDTSAVVAEYKTTGMVPGEEGSIFKSIVDSDAATGGQVDAVHVTVVGSGNITTYALHAGQGVNPVDQDSGVFAAVDTAFTFDDSLTAFADVTSDFNSVSSNTTLFVETDDLVYIGEVVKFGAVEVLLTTPASNPGIKAQFEFWNGSSWFDFGPTDGSNGFRNNGSIAWDINSLTGWATTSVNGASKFWIRIRRTSNNLNTLPIELLIKTAGAVSYQWNADGNLSVKGVAAETLSATQSLTVSGIPVLIKETLENAITGSDGITIVSGSNTTDVVGFRTEFVAASGSLQSQIDAGEASDVDSINAQTGAVTITGTTGINTATAGGVITLTSEDSEIDHGNIAGLADDDHLQYILVDSTRDFASDVTISGELSVGDRAVSSQSVDINSNNGAALRLLDQDVPQWRFQTSNGDLQFIDDVSFTEPLRINQGATDQSVVIENGGDVGIGAAPAFKLDVRGDILRVRNFADAGAVVIIDSGSTAKQHATLSFRDRGTQTFLVRAESTGNFLIKDNIQNHNVLTILPNSGNANAVVVSSGNVGIGATPSSTVKLDVAGTGRFDGNLEVGKGTLSDQMLEIDANNKAALHLLNSGAVQWSIDNSGGDFRFVDHLDSSSVPLIIEAGAGADTVVLDSSGNVGIGVAPGAFKLDVAGGGNFEEVTAVTGTFSQSLTVSGLAVLTNESVIALGHVHEQVSAGVTWNINHNLDTLTPVVEVWENSNQITQFDSATAVDANNITIEFNTSISGTAVVLSQGNATDINTTVIKKLPKSFTVEFPTDSETLPFFYTTINETVNSIMPTISGSEVDSGITWSVRYDSDPLNFTGATEVVTGGTNTDLGNNGIAISSFNNPSIPAGSHIWIETTLSSGTVNNLSLTVLF